MQFRNPVELSDAFSLLASGDWKILSGGTDFYPSLGSNVPQFNVLDVSGIKAMRSIEKDADGDWHIGALVTWTDILRHDLPSAFNGLKLAAREVGSVQIQNRATLVGNICNASPAADGVPPLLTLNACVKIGSQSGLRKVPLQDFILGNRKTDLKAGEMVVGLTIPAEAAKGRSSFLKLGARKYLVISISMVAARLMADANGTIEDAAISVGSCSVVAKRLNDFERSLIGCSVDDDLASFLKDGHLDVLSPIDDVRATSAYRLNACKELVGRTVYQAAQGVEA